VSKNLKKHPNPPLVSFLASEPNFWLIKKAFLYDFDNMKKVTKKQGMILSLAVLHARHQRD
jgi:hypothetical protein